MKIKNIIGIICVLMIWSSCKKENTAASIDLQKPIVQSTEYYANLRAYKQSNHEIAFGWFGGSGGDGKVASMQNRWESIPDSMDIVACWGGIPSIGTDNYDAMQKVRTLKGIKIVTTIFGSGVEALLKKNDSALFFVNKDTMTAIDNVAKAINDTINKYQIDGFDLDYETAFGDNTFFGASGGSATNDRYTQRLFKAFSQYLGPQSGTGKLLIVDGQSDVGIIPYIDYFMQQAYGANSGSNLQSRMTTYGGSSFPPEKFVPCENFESSWSTGGVNFSDPIHGTIPSLLGFAYWNPVGGRKGGCGAYHMEYEYNNQVQPYMYMKQAIQIMNPAVY